MAAPYMPLYVADYLADTTHLTTAEHGAYILLIMAMWRAGGSLPNEDKRLASICKMSISEWAEIASTMREFFIIGDGLTHKRVTKEYLAYNKKKDLAKASADKRWNKTNNIDHANAYETHMPNGCERNANSEPELEPVKEDVLGSPARGLEGWPQDYETILLAETKIGRHQSITEFALWHHNGFDFEAEVLPAIRSVMTSGRPPPKTWKYFSPVIAQLRADRSNPIHIPEANHVRNNNLQSRSGGQRSKTAGLKAAIAVANRRAERASGAG